MLYPVRESGLMSVVRYGTPQRATHLNEPSRDLGGGALFVRGHVAVATAVEEDADDGHLALLDAELLYRVA